MTIARFPYFMCYLTGVFLGAVSQIMLKKEAMKPHRSFLAEYLNVRVILSYAIFFGCTLLTLLSYRGIPMNWGPVLETAGYLFVTVLGATILKERITKKKVAALGIIVFGILVYAL